MTAHIDLDGPLEPPPSRPRPRRRFGLYALGLALAVTAIVVTVQRTDGPPEKPGRFDVAPAWETTLPVELGEALAARVVGGTVLLATTQGLSGYDRATGAEKWRTRLDEHLAWDRPAPRTREVAWRHVRIGADAVVIPYHLAPDASAPRDYFEVRDLHTGALRHTITPGGGGGGRWREAAVMPDRLITYACEEAHCTVVAYSLADGAELWRDRRDAVPQFPVTTSASHQPVAVRNPGPVVPDPLTRGVIVWSEPADEKGTTLVFTTSDLGTGGEMGTWTAPRPGAAMPFYRDIGGNLVDVSTANVLRGVNPVDGTDLWTRATLTDLDAGFTDAADPRELEEPPSLVAGRLLDTSGHDSRTAPGSYQLIDLRTGEIAATPAAAGNRIISVADAIAIGLDPAKGELTAVAFGDSLVWNAPLRPDGWTQAGLEPSGFLTSGGWFALAGELGFGQDAEQRLWYVELGTGAIGAIPAAELLGLDDGAMVTADTTGRRTVALRELGVR
ncbi:hypothetical protein AB0I28_22630 [Phytomonospora sp. NPDC050363]|uniref:hypothetical protein n=1 Tax=Phytomonospora sp. NPDC050363 TaxID=3155642 RepID=UPI0033D829CC